MLSPTEFPSPVPRLDQVVELGYAAAEERIASFTIDELPPGATYQGTQNNEPEDSTPETSELERAWAMLQNVGSICFGETPNVIEIVAPDGRPHTIQTTDPESLIAFLVGKGYEPKEQTEAFEYPLRFSGVLNLGIEAPAAPDSSLTPLGSRNNLQHSRPRHSREVRGAGTGYYEPITSPEIPKMHVISPFAQLTLLRRVMTDEVQNALEVPIINRLTSHYELTEEEVDAAFTEVMDFKLLDADLSEEAGWLDSVEFTPETCKVINAALDELIRTTPSVNEQNRILARAAATMRESGLSEGDLTGALASYNTRRGDVEIAEYLRRYNLFTLCRAKTMPSYKDGYQPPAGDVHATAYVDPVTDSPAGTTRNYWDKSFEQPVVKTSFMGKIKNGFGKLGRQIGASLKNFAANNL